MRVRRPLRLSQNIRDAHAFKYGTHCTTGHNTRTCRCRLDEDFSTTKLCGLFMRHGSFQYRDTSQVFLCSFNTFSNCSGYFTCFTKTPTNNSIFVTNNHDSRKAKSSTTFCHFSNTIDSYKSIFQFDVVSYFNSIINCHNHLKFKSTVTSSVCYFFYSPMIQVTVTVEYDSRNTSLLCLLSNQFANFGSLLFLRHGLQA